MLEIIYSYQQYVDLVSVMKMVILILIATIIGVSLTCIMYIHFMNKKPKEKTEDKKQEVEKEL